MPLAHLAPLVTSEFAGEIGDCSFQNSSGSSLSPPESALAAGSSGSKVGQKPISPPLKPVPAKSFLETDVSASSKTPRRDPKP